MHTKGPWKFEEQPFCNIESADGTVVEGQGFMLSDAHDDESIRANAHLIAAAPDLLESLRLLVERCQRELADPEDVSELTMATIAIAKAEGRP